jgi:3',5'-nucleoside bisphosphate phosphatase
VMVKTINKVTEIELPFEILSAIHAPNSHPTVTLQVKVK